MRKNWICWASAACVAGAAVFFGSHGLAPAATHEQIIEACKEAARPTVIACIQKRRGAADFETLREQCRQSVGVPFVKACVLREEQKEAVGKPAPPAPKMDETTPPSAEPALVRPSFVAPPRTTADIRAILDQEKPDPAKIAARRTAAEGSPPGSAAAAETAQFYYDRAGRQSAARPQQGGSGGRADRPGRGQEEQGVSAGQPRHAVRRASLPCARGALERKPKRSMLLPPPPRLRASAAR